MSRGSSEGIGACGQRPDQPTGCRLLTCDRTDRTSFLEALTSPTTPTTIVDFAAMEPAHVEAVIDAHASKPIRHYIFISTNMVYPGGPDSMDLSDTYQGTAVSESEARCDTADTTPAGYGGNKLRCEALLAASTLPSTIIRPPAVVGSGCDSRHERLQRLVTGRPPMVVARPSRPPAASGGRFRVAWSGDVAALIALVAARLPATGAEAFNVASGNGEGVTLDEYAALMVKAVGTGSVATRAPAAALPPGGVPSDPQLRNYEKQAVLSTHKAEQELGFRPTPVEEWLGEVVAWHEPLLPSPPNAGSAAALSEL